MLMYWLMFLTTASIALFTGQNRRPKLMPWMILGVFFILIIGLRHRVGGDWGNYMYHYEMVIGVPFSQLPAGKDPGHQWLNWLMAQWDLGIYGINMIYGIVFMIGLIKFSRDQLYPWIAMAVAVPYLVIVVAMGYSRQGMAIGIFMIAITYLRKGKLKTYVGLILLAALFHKTAIILLPLGVFLYGKKGVLLRIVMIVPLVYGAWAVFLADAQSNLMYQYIDRDMQSAGAKIRVAMNLLPSVLLLIYRKEWKRNFDDYAFWFWIAMGSIGTAVLVGIASTAADRLALYFIPIQLAVYARLPYLARNSIAPSVTKVMILVGYTVVLFVWLVFGAHSYAWVPYQNLLWLDLF